MAISPSKELTGDGAAKRFFLEPEQPLHRQYEALRAYFVEGMPSAEVAQKFGYSPGSFRVLCHHFRAAVDRGDKFFREHHLGGGDAQTQLVGVRHPAGAAGCRS